MVDKQASVLKSYLPENPPPYSSCEAGSSVPLSENVEQIQNLVNLAIDGSKTRVVERGETKCDRKLVYGLIALVALLLAILLILLGLVAFHFLSRNPEMELMAAMEKNNVEKVQQLLEQCKVDVNARLPEYQGRAALHLAAQHGYVGIVRLLLAHGANATLRSSNRDWQSPLHAAANMECRPEIVKMLLDAGAKPEEKDGTGKQAIEYSTNGGCRSAMYDRSYQKQWAIEWREKWRKVQEEIHKPTDWLFSNPNALREQFDKISKIIRSK